MASPNRTEIVQQDPVELILSRVGSYIERPSGYRLRCPIHEGKSKDSVSLSRSEDGWALLHCFAGCATVEVVAVWGLEMADLFPGRWLPALGSRAGLKSKWLYAVKHHIVIPEHVYLTARELARYTNDLGGNCHPGIERLATGRAVSERTVRRHLDELEDLGSFRRERRVKRGMRGRGSRQYEYLLIPPVMWCPEGAIEHTGRGIRVGASIAAEYNYTDENGHLLFQQVRRAPKGFLMRRPDGDGGWIWNIMGVRLVLYRLPVVLEAVAAGEVLFVVEGERDVHAIERAGGVATCNPMGAGSWMDAYSETLRGARVVVVADRDEAGREHARTVAASLCGVAESVELVRPAVEGPGADATDHVDAGYSLAEFEPLEAPEAGTTIRTSQGVQPDTVPDISSTANRPLGHDQPDTSQKYATDQSDIAKTTDGTFFADQLDISDLGDTIGTPVKIGDQGSPRVRGSSYAPAHGQRTGRGSLVSSTTGGVHVDGEVDAGEEGTEGEERVDESVAVDAGVEGESEHNGSGAEADYDRDFIALSHILDLEPHDGEFTIIPREHESLALRALGGGDGDVAEYDLALERGS